MSYSHSPVSRRDEIHLDGHTDIDEITFLNFSNLSLIVCDRHGIVLLKRLMSAFYTGGFTVPRDSSYVKIV